MARRVRKFNKLVEKYSWVEPELEEDSETLERVKLCECDLPLLKENEEIFLSEQGVYTTVQKVTTGTDGNVYYNISYVSEYVDETESTKETLLPKLNEAKTKYYAQKKIDKEASQKYTEEKQQRLQKLKDEVKVIRDWQKDNIDKIKGIIIHETPKDKDNKFSIYKEDMEEYTYNIILSIPKEFLVITTLNKVTYLDCTDKNLSVAFQ
jgi:hypothetical protein